MDFEGFQIFGLKMVNWYWMNMKVLAGRGLRSSSAMMEFACWDVDGSEFTAVLTEVNHTNSLSKLEFYNQSITEPS